MGCKNHGSKTGHRVTKSRAKVERLKDTAKKLKGHRKRDICNKSQGYISKTEDGVIESRILNDGIEQRYQTQDRTS